MKEIIEKLVEGIITSFNIEYPIKDFEEVVSKMGGRVEKVEDLKRLFNGSIQKSGDGFIIYISAYMDEDMKRYCIARDLGFVFLSMGYKTNEKLWNSFEDGRYYNCNRTGEIVAAKYFAYALLMPEKIFRGIIKEYSEVDKVKTKELAEYFGVPVALVHNRGVMLGLFEER